MLPFLGLTTTQMDTVHLVQHVGSQSCQGGSANELLFFYSTLAESCSDGRLDAGYVCLLQVSAPSVQE
jgi:hypothetical protein